MSRQKSQNPEIVQHVALSELSPDSQSVCAEIVQHVALSESANDSQSVCADRVQHVALSEEMARIAAGDIPTDLDSLGAIGSSLLAVNAKVRQTISVIIASARELLSLREWVAWCDDRFSLDVASRSHMAAVGRLLLACREERRALYVKAFPLDFEKLYALTAITESQVVAFMTPNIDIIKNMSREEVRVLVARHLGKERQPKATQPDMPGFESMLDTLSAADEMQLATAVQSDATASKALTASQRILNSAIVYYHAASDILSLHKIKTTIKGDLAELEAAIAMLSQDE